MYNLLGHMHLHAGSKPFKCPYCTSKFNLKGNLSRHMKVKHGILDTSNEGQGDMQIIPQIILAYGLLNDRTEIALRFIELLRLSVGLFLWKLKKVNANASESLLSSVNKSTTACDIY